ncbi:MAG: hypothetical protein GPW18_04570 [Euryarchaeota archaeon]|jgi:hypothetical protein|nr:hypothetical protein [Euryarchaeota archaeon]
MDEIDYAQLHLHSRFSVNSLSGEGVIHGYIWPLERLVVKELMLKPEKISRISRRMGISYVAITDHNIAQEYEDDVIIRSEEWGQRKGHANFIGINRTIFPECGYFKKKEPEEKMDFFRAVKIAKEMGAFTVINHPFKRDCWLWGDESFKMVDAIEVWNGKWNEENKKALELWQGLLLQNIRILPMAGSDFHIPYLNKMNENLIVTEKTSDKNDFLNSLRNGKYSITRDTKSPYIFLYEDLDYVIGKKIPGIEMRIFTPSIIKKLKDPPANGNLGYLNDEFVRVELWMDDNPLSISTPVFKK